MVVGSFLENGFEATWRWKTIFLGFKCDIFHFFCTVLRDKVETIVKESKSEPPKWFHFKICQRKYFRNWFWSYLEVKNECSERLKMDIYIYIYIFFAHFLVNKLKMFLRKAGQSTQNCVNLKSDIVYILENGFETTLRSKAGSVVEPLKKTNFSFLHIFEWRSWNNFQEKWGKAFKSI